MKKIVLLSIAMLFSALCHAQIAEETQVTYEGKTITAYSVSLSYAKDLVTDALAQRFKEAALKANKSNGYIVVQNQIVNDLSTHPIDFIIKMDEQGRKDNRSTDVVFFATTYNLSISRADLNLNVKHYAESFVNYVARYDAQQKMSDEEKNLKKAQRNQVKAVAAVNSIDKNINSDQEKIAKKEAEIAKYQEKIEALRSEINDLKSKIEKNQGKKSQAEENVNKANTAVQSSEDEVERYRQKVQE